ncbi:MAG TPA: VWA domain-containing protein [Candidatus Limnocylindrales bacterium]|nr:VWA domain-containing protein [Candidatus Limnocylindrales bacterium]
MRAVFVSQQKTKLPRPRQLDSGLTWHRDPATGELVSVPSPGAEKESKTNSSSTAATLRVTTRMVPVTCSVFAADGAAVAGLSRNDFRVFDDGVEQTISYFDVSTMPASVALIIDASPSVLRDSEAMKQAAESLIAALSPADEVAVVDFSAHVYELSDFSSDRERVRRAVSRINVRELSGDTGGSIIYEAVYLTAAKVFLGGREGRKAIVLLTDGQDSGLGLTLKPATAAPRPGMPANRLTFEDVARRLAAEDIQVFAISTENRPKVMTPEWLSAHGATTLVNYDAPKSGIPAYTLYLAELVRRAGGQLYFLRESQSLAEVFRRIAQRIGAEYTVGFEPAANSGMPARAGWHQLRVEVAGHPRGTVIHRAAYYVPGSTP